MENLRKKMTTLEEMPADSIYELRYKLKKLTAIRDMVKEQEATVASVTQQLELEQRWTEFLKSQNEDREARKDDDQLALTKRIPNTMDFLLNRRTAHSRHRRRALVLPPPAR